MKNEENEHKKKPHKTIAYDSMHMLDMIMDDFMDENALYFNLKSGKRLSVSAICFSSTYGGTMGFPSKRINEHIVQGWDYPTNWGKRKTLFLPPTEEELNDLLKPFYCSVWLTSKKTVRGENDYDASGLVILFSTNLLKTHVITELLTLELVDLDWEKEAENFNY